MPHDPTIDAFFTAMQGGARTGDDLIALFTDEAVYVESFTGRPMTHTGVVAIRAAFAHGWERPLPDMRITLDRVEVRATTIVADWTCHSPALPGGKGSGRNVFTLEHGRITRLETTLA